MKTEDLAKLSTIVLKSVTSVVIPGSQLKEESDTDPSSVVSPSCSGKRARSTTLLQEGSKLEPQCHLTRIPMELLAEILLYLPSTKCILAVARCSKYFCDTLVTNKSSVFIWRNVRAACKPYAIPEPTPNFTEPAYAAFIFDGGECEVCKKKTSAMYISFALRARLCGQPKCRMHFTQEYINLASQSISTQCFFKWLPSAESDSCMSSNTTSYWPNAQRWYRKAQLTRAQAEYSQASHAGLLQSYEERHKIEIERLPVFMKWSVDLYTWKQERHTRRLEVRTKNNASAQLLATKEGWTTYDLVNSQTYGALFRNRTNNLEEVTMSEYESIRAIVDAEMTKIIEARKRSSHEEAYRRRRSDVEQHYNRLKSSGKEKVLPNLAEFRRLPIINVLQSKTSTTTGVAGDLQKSQLVAELLQDDLRKWRESARMALTLTLGFSNWKSASKTKLHPVDRLTARFRCKKCARNDHKVYEEECLDFAGACAHVCLQPNLKKRTRDRWTADQFEKDDKAINVISKVLELCGVNAEERESIQKVEALGSRIRCQSCESKITMTFRSLFGHAQRHQNMQLSLVSAEEAGSFSMRHFEFGTCSKLLSPKLQAKKLRDMQNYGCRHCHHVAAGATSNNATTGAEASRLSKRSPATNATRLFSFNGLRSHLKEKHGIERICDEDIFWEKALVWT